MPAPPIGRCQRAGDERVDGRWPMGRMVDCGRCRDWALVEAVRVATAAPVIDASSMRGEPEVVELPETVYPFPIPLSRVNAEAVVRGDAPGVAGAFAGFVMIPTASRMGRWRFAGSAPVLAPMVTRLGEFALEVGLDTGTPRSVVEAWLAFMTLRPRGVRGPVRHAIHYDALPLDALGPHRVVLYAEGEAPHDDAGCCILEVASPEVIARLANMPSLKVQRRTPR